MQVEEKGNMSELIMTYFALMTRMHVHVDIITDAKDI